MISKERQLSELFIQLFEEPDSLQRFIMFGPSGESVMGNMPPKGSLQRLAVFAVDILARHGLVTADLFERLRDEFPSKSVEISAAEHLWVPSLDQWMSAPEPELPVAGEAANVFVSYARRDSSFLDELLPHLAVLRRKGLINVWHEGRIRGGEDWESAIKSGIETADVILLLVSSDFLASDFVWDMELKLALNRMKSGDAVVIPILVRPCAWQKTPLANLQALPGDGISISEHSDTDAAWLEVARKIQRVFEQKRAGQV